MFDPLFAHCMFDKLSARLGQAVHAVPSCREETANFLVVRWCFVCQHKYTRQKMMKHVWQHVCSLHYASNSASGQTACILSTEETGMEGGKGGKFFSTKPWRLTKSEPSISESSKVIKQEREKFRRTEALFKPNAFPWHCFKCVENEIKLMLTKICQQE